jgi:hypothetical protein
MGNIRSNDPSNIRNSKRNPLTRLISSRVVGTDLFAIFSADAFSSDLGQKWHTGWEGRTMRISKVPSSGVIMPRPDSSLNHLIVPAAQAKVRAAIELKARAILKRCISEWISDWVVDTNRIPGNWDKNERNRHLEASP